MTRIKVIFIPGNGGCTPRDNWFPSLKKTLTKKGISVIDKDFPDPELARQKYWLPFLIDELGVDNNTILVGHSSGAIAAMKVAQTHNIMGSVLVGAYHTDLGMDTEKKSGYFDQPWNWDAIKQNQQWTLLFASEDDPWIPIAEPRYIHQQLNCEYYEFKDQGHFGGDYLKLEFPELTQALLSKIRKS